MGICPPWRRPNWFSDGRWSDGGDGIPGMVAPSAPMDAAIAAIDEVAAEVIADEAPDVPETGPDGDPGMVDEQPQDDPSDIA